MSEGNPDIEKFMKPVEEAIRRHIKWPSEEFTDIYNKTYEAIGNAIAQRTPGEPKEKSGVELIADERRRQIEQEGWTSQHDDQWDNFQLLSAAITYLCVSNGDHIKRWWPWRMNWFKPSHNRIINMKKAGALIAAEI